MDTNPLILTFKLALVTTLILFVISIPISFWLAFSKSKLKLFWETLISMPIVLPPTVLGFYFLLVFSPNSWLGSLLNDWFSIKLVFSFSGLVLASVIYSLPFMVHPIQSGLSGLPSSLREASLLMGKTKFVTLFYVLLPNIKPSVLTGLVLTFAHTVGEFGVVMMIGGSIPGKTKVASIAIYDEVEMLRYGNANRYSLILFAISFFVLFVLYFINRNEIKYWWK